MSYKLKLRKNIIILLLTIVIILKILGINVLAEKNDLLEKNNLIENKSIAENGTCYDLNINIPQLNSLEDKVFQVELNETIKSKIINVKDELILSALEFEKDCKNFGWEIEPYKITTDYKVYHSNSGIISVVVRTYLFTGGMNGNLYYDTYNIDTRNNKLVNLKDLFKKDAEYIDIINTTIKEQIESKKSQGIAFYENFAEFQSISSEQDFYIKDNTLYIIFEKGIIAPRSQGTIEFEIKEINNNILPKIIIGEKAHQFEPVVVNATVMLPFRYIVEELGYNIVWIGDINMIVIHKDDKWATISIGENICANNITTIYKLETCPKLVGSKTYISSDFFTNILQVQILKENNNYIIKK